MLHIYLDGFAQVGTPLNKQLCNTVLAGLVVQVTDQMIRKHGCWPLHMACCAPVNKPDLTQAGAGRLSRLVRKDSQLHMQKMLPGSWPLAAQLANLPWYC